MRRQGRGTNHQANGGHGMNCLACNNELTGRQRLYCSSPCGRRVRKRIAKGEPVADGETHKRCPVCDKRFKKYRRTQNCCSVSCSTLAWQRRQAGKPIATAKPCKKACANCGKVFTWTSKHPKQRSCGSRACKYAIWAKENAAARKEYRAQWWKAKQGATA